MKKLLSSLLVFLIIAASLIFIGSPNGLQLLLRIASAVSHRTLMVGQADGGLFSSWRLRDIELILAGADISIAEISCAWRPADLAQGKLFIGRLSAGGIVVGLKEDRSGRKTEKADSVGLPAALLPFSLGVDQLDVAGLKIVHADGSVATDIHRLQLGIKGDRHRLEITGGLVEAARYGLTLHGFIDAGADWATDVMGSWRISPAGGYAEMAGTYSARGPLDALQVEAGAERPAEVRVSGILQGLPDNPHWQARAVGHHVWFPVFHPHWPRLMLDAEVNAAGDFNVYHGTVKASGSFLDFKGIAGTADVAGTGRGLTARTVHLSSSDGIVIVSNLALDWWDAFSWSGEVKTESFNPAGFDARFVGVLDADLLSTGYLGYEDADELQTDTDIRFLAGTLRGFPIGGKGRVRSDAARFTVEDVLLQSGSSHLEAAGRIAEAYDLQFSLSSPNAGEILPGSEGVIEASGKISGGRDYPAFDLDLDAAGIRYGREKIGRLTANIHVDTRPGADMEATVDGEDIDWAGTLIRRGQVVLTGTAETHDLHAALQLGAADLRFAIQGGISDRQWRGKLADTSLSGPDLGIWLQFAGADLEISPTGADLSDFCLVQAEGRICLDAGWRNDETHRGWTVDGDVSELPLAMFSENGLAPWPMTGRINFTMSAEGDGEGVTAGDASLSIPEILIESGMAEDGIERFLLQGTSLNLHLAGGKLGATLKSQFQDSSSLQMEIGIADAGSFSRPLLQQPITGKVRLDLQDISLIAPLTRYMIRPTGRIESTLAIAGSLSRPIFEGRLDLQDGRMAVPSLGIFLEEVGISLAAVGEEVEMKVSARSGPGRATADGILGYADNSGIHGQFAISGTDFEVVSLPEYEIQVNPEVIFSFTRDSGKLTGILNVPRAHLAPNEMKGAVEVSKDVVYVDREEEEKIRHWPLESEVEVRLGDDVRLEGYGLKGRLSGSLAIRDTSDTFMSGKGELALEDGTFSLYGRSLAIERGRMLFSGGPVDNPGIDARAVQYIKEKSDLDGNMTIGVDVSGFLQELEFKLFSDPSMDEGDILAYMVVGHSMSDTNPEEGGILQAAASTIGLGEGAELVTTLTGLLPVDEMHLEGTEEDGNYSLVVGKKLTDRLYIGYDHNFFDQKGAFRVSYDLGYGFSAVSRSSADSNAADLFYSIER